MRGKNIDMNKLLRALLREDSEPTYSSSHMEWKTELREGLCASQDPKEASALEATVPPEHETANKALRSVFPIE